MRGSWKTKGPVAGCPPAADAPWMRDTGCACAIVWRSLSALSLNLLSSVAACFDQPAMLSFLADASQTWHHFDTDNAQSLALEQ